MTKERERLFILLTIITNLTSCIRFEYIVRKSIPLRTCRELLNFTSMYIRKSIKTLYERPVFYTHFYERF